MVCYVNNNQLKMTIEKEKNNVFKISWDKRQLICPPDQVFKKNDFEFLLTIGGNLVDNETEYQKLMTFLKSIDETEFVIVENFGVIETKNEIPFVGKLSTNSNFDSFQKMGQTFDPIFSWTIGNFFIYGNNKNWGIYICECPTINIIGCDKKYVSAFRRVFGIKGNGFNELDEFISKEFQTIPDFKKQLIKNYKLVP